MALQRPKQPMPEDVSRRLSKLGLMVAYEERPPYQRNDYLAWIDRAKQEATRERRIAQMLDELAAGDVYMKMRWSPAKRRTR